MPLFFDYTHMVVVPHTVGGILHPKHRGGTTLILIKKDESI